MDACLRGLRGLVLKGVEGCERVRKVLKGAEGCLLELEGTATKDAVAGFAITLRRRMHKNARVLFQGATMYAASFNDIVSASVGCNSISTLNGYLAQLRQMGIAPTSISHAAFGQHSRAITLSDSSTLSAIRGLPHSPKKRNARMCSHVIRGGVKQCPKSAKRDMPYCSRHCKRQLFDQTESFGPESLVMTKIYQKFKRYMYIRNRTA